MFDKNKDIMVLNYNAFPVVASTKLQDFTFPAAKRGSYTSLPLSWDEVIQINNNSKAFKNGFLMFLDEEKDEIYKALRIMNPENILTNEQVENIILHPTLDGVRRLIEIDDDAYFDRIRGIYTFLRNNGYDISNRIDSIISARYMELKNNKKTSSIVLSEKLSNTDAEKIKELEEKLSEMDALREKLAKLEKALSATQEPKENTGEKNNSEKAPADEVAKPITKKRTSTAGSKKTK